MDCSIYTPPFTTWPVQSFPKTAFPRWAGQRLTRAQRAWTFYEQVEATDAATRIRLSGTSTPPSWYPFNTEGDRLLHKDGKELHMLVCPTIGWTAQRNQGIPPTLVTTLQLPQCSSGT